MEKKRERKGTMSFFFLLLRPPLSLWFEKPLLQKKTPYRICTLSESQ